MDKSCKVKAHAHSISVDSKGLAKCEYTFNKKGIVKSMKNMTSKKKCMLDFSLQFVSNEKTCNKGGSNMVLNFLGRCG